MESRKNDGRDGGDAVDAWQGVQHLDMPDLDIPNLGEITSTFEPVTDVAPPHADASALIASPIPSVSDSPESVTRGGASSVGLSDSAESDTRGGAGGAGLSDSAESDTLAAAYAASAASRPQAKPAAFTAQPKEPGLSTQEMSEVHARSYAAAIPHPTGAAAAEQPPQIPLAPVKRVQAQFNPLADLLLYLVVFVGGCIGTAMRFGLAEAFPSPLARRGVLSAFHVATFGANMVACLVLAMVTIGMSHASWLTRRVKQLVSKGVGLGVCGGCSTLSTLGIEELASLRGGEIGGTVLYVLVTFACGALCSVLGVKLGLLLTARRKSQVLQEAVRNAMRSDGDSGPVIEGVPQNVVERFASGNGWKLYQR